jgi:hypothetical protein
MSLISVGASGLHVAVLTRELKVRLPPESGRIASSSVDPSLCHEPTSVETDAAEDPTGYNVDQVRKEFRRAETKTVNLNQI